MDEIGPLLAVVPGDDGPAIRALFAAFVAAQRRAARIVGVIEEGADSGRTGWLRTLAGDQRFGLFQDLGAGAAGCAVDQPGIEAAGEQVRRDMAAGADLVVLNKFGKLEAEFGAGLRETLAAAMLAGIPVLTSVASRHAAAWARFAGPLSIGIAPEPGAIMRWWQGVRR